jgi:hypothetical protein
MVRVRIMLSLLLLAATLALVSAAYADGNPASDVLLASNVFTPYPPPAPTALRKLTGAIDAVDLNGDRVKVAVVATSSDLGSVPSLFGHPQNYAAFLSLELSAIYKGPLLVVMPAGFGFVDRTQAVAGANMELSRMSIHSPSPADLTLAAAEAVNGLEHARLLRYKDTFAPAVTPQGASVAGGRLVALRYQVWDDSGRARFEIEVQNARQVGLSRFHVPLRKVAPGTWYFVAWHVPRALSHRVLNFCAQGVDAAGNHSHRSCTKLTVT